MNSPISISRCCLLATAVAASTLLGAPANRPEVGLGEGQYFPDLHLPTLEDGRYASISSFRGKKTLLLVYASW